MPYADHGGSVWTGYFSSRANLKQYVRKGSSNLHAANQLFSLKVLDLKVTDEYIDEILTAKHVMLDAMGVLQHHDAVSGTERQLVSEDYQDILNNAHFQNSKYHTKVMKDIINKDAGYDADMTGWNLCP